MNDRPENEKLAKALEELSKERLFIPPEVDDRVIKAAGQHFRQKSFKRVARFPHWQSWAAAAAAVALVLVLVRPFRTAPESRPESTMEAHGSDINKDGVVDVLDALALAHASKQNSVGVDLNRDGVFDERDAKDLLNSLVRLDTGGPL